MAEHMEYIPEKDQNWVRSLLVATFGPNGVPDARVSLDPKMLAEQQDDAEFHVFLRSGHARPVGVRLSQRWTPVSEVVAKAGPSPEAGFPETFVDLRAGQEPWLLNAGLEPVPGKTTPSGRPAIGFGFSEGGERSWYGVFEGFPEAMLPEGLGRDRVAAIRGVVGEIPWFVRETGDGDVVSVVAATDDLSPHGAVALFGALPELAEGWSALNGAYTSRGCYPRAYWFEVWPDGSVEVAIHGVRSVRREDSLDLGGAEGREMEARVRAAVLASLPADGKDQGAKVWDEALWPSLMRVWPGGKLTDSDMLSMLPQPAPDIHSHAVTVSRHVLARLQLVEPDERVALMGKLAHSARGSALLREAYGLAAARYRLKFPEVALPPQIPQALLELSEEEVIGRATSLQGEAEETLAALKDDPERPFYVLPGQPEVMEIVPEMLRRAIDGTFVGAPGPLFDYLDQVGRGAFEDDASAISLEHVDLEPGEREKALSSLEAADLEDDLSSQAAPRSGGGSDLEAGLKFPLSLEDDPESTSS